MSVSLWDTYSNQQMLVYESESNISTRKNAWGSWFYQHLYIGPQDCHLLSYVYGHSHQQSNQILSLSGVGVMPLFEEDPVGIVKICCLTYELAKVNIGNIC